MADTGADFITFLQANYPEDYNKLSSDSVTDSLVNAIISKHKSHFDLWLKVPERIRDEYLGRVPHDIIEAAKTDNNLTLAECREIEAERKLAPGINEHSSSPIYDAANGYIPAPTILLAHAAFKNIEFSKKDQQEIVKKSEQHKKHGYSNKAAAEKSVCEKAKEKINQKVKNGTLSEEEAHNAINVVRKQNLNISYQDIHENQPERELCKYVLKELVYNKTTEEEIRSKIAELTKKIKESGREELLVKNMNYNCYASTFRKLNEKQLNILVEECLSKISNVDFDSLRKSTPDNASYKNSILNKLAFEYLKEQENDNQKQNVNIANSTPNKTQDNTEVLSFTNNRKQIKRYIKQEYIDNQPEKMLIHIAKQLNRGKIDKETALPQMDVLMKKVKDMGREQQLSEYLKQPQSGYNKFNEDNKVLFNELMLSHEVGAVSQNLNKVRNMTTKDTPVTEAKTAYVPTSDKAFNQTKIINSKIVQER